MRMPLTNKNNSKNIEWKFFMNFRETVQNGATKTKSVRSFESQQKMSVQHFEHTGCVNFLKKVIIVFEI